MPVMDGQKGKLSLEPLPFVHRHYFAALRKQLSATIRIKTKGVAHVYLPLPTNCGTNDIQYRKSTYLLGGDGKAYP